MDSYLDKETGKLHEIENVICQPTSRKRGEGWNIDIPAGTSVFGRPVIRPVVPSEPE